MINVQYKWSLDGTLVMKLNFVDLFKYCIWLDQNILDGFR